MTEWKDVIGLWGAVLSTITAIHLFFSSRPIYFFEPMRNSKEDIMYPNGELRLILHIINPSKRAVFQIKKVNFIWKKGEKDIDILPVVKDSNLRETLGNVYDWMDAKKSRDYYLYLGPQSECKMAINNIKEDTDWLLILWWHRHGILPAFPLFLRINWAKAIQINRGNKGAEIKNREENA